MLLQHWEALAAWDLASGLEACVQHDSQIVDPQQVEELEWAIGP